MRCAPAGCRCWRRNRALRYGKRRMPAGGDALPPGNTQIEADIVLPPVRLCHQKLCLHQRFAELVVINVKKKLVRRPLPPVRCAHIAIAEQVEHGFAVVEPHLVALDAQFSVPGARFRRASTNSGADSHSSRRRGTAGCFRHKPAAPAGQLSTAATRGRTGASPLAANSWFRRNCASSANLPLGRWRMNGLQLRHRCGLARLLPGCQIGGKLARQIRFYALPAEKQIGVQRSAFHGICSPRELRRTASRAPA